MSVDFRRMLLSSLNDPCLRKVAEEALHVTEQSSVKAQHDSETRGSATEAAEDWDRRLRSGFIEKERFSGIEETIASLRRAKSEVGFCMIDAESGIVSIWFVEERDSPVGIIVSTAKSDAHKIVEGKML